MCLEKWLERVDFFINAFLSSHLPEINLILIRWKVQFRKTDTFKLTKGRANNLVNYPKQRLSQFVLKLSNGTAWLYYRVFQSYGKKIWAYNLGYETFYELMLVEKFGIYRTFWYLAFKVNKKHFSSKMRYVEKMSIFKYK